MGRKQIVLINCQNKWQEKKIAFYPPKDGKDANNSHQSPTQTQTQTLGVCELRTANRKSHPFFRAIVNSSMGKYRFLFERTMQHWRARFDLMAHLVFIVTIFEIS